MKQVSPDDKRALQAVFEPGVCAAIVNAIEAFVPPGPELSAKEWERDCEEIARLARSLAARLRNSRVMPHLPMVARLAREVPVPLDGWNGDAVPPDLLLRLGELEMFCRVGQQYGGWLDLKQGGRPADTVAHGAAAAVLATLFLRRVEITDGHDSPATRAVEIAFHVHGIDADARNHIRRWKRAGETPRK
jgi:hypothetical protein